MHGAVHGDGRACGASRDVRNLKTPNEQTLFGNGAPPVSPLPSACLLPLLLCKPLALTVVLKTALPITSEAPYERDLTERRRRILQHREQRTGARGSFVTGLPPPPSSRYYAPWLLLGVDSITEFIAARRLKRHVQHDARCPGALSSNGTRTMLRTVI
jgi:hypothetical protein